MYIVQRGFSSACFIVLLVDSSDWSSRHLPHTHTLPHTIVTLVISCGQTTVQYAAMYSVQRGTVSTWINIDITTIM